MASTDSEAARAHTAATERLPEAPPRRSRCRPWRAVDLVALGFQATDADPDPGNVVSFGLVPVHAGRVDVGGAQYRKVTWDGGISPKGVVASDPPSEGRTDAPTLDETLERLRAALDRRYIITWVAEVETAALDDLFGGGRIRWLNRTIDVRRLASILDRLDGRLPQPEGYQLASRARAYGVPPSRPCDPLDAALMTAQLFLVLATKLDLRGYREVGRLLWHP